MFYCPECKKLVFGDVRQWEEPHWEVAEFGYVPCETFEEDVCEDCGCNELETSSHDKLGNECCPDEEYSEDSQDDIEYILKKVVEEFEGIGLDYDWGDAVDILADYVKWKNKEESKAIERLAD